MIQSSGMTIVGLILAAGHGRRVGGVKALLEVDGETFLERTAKTLQRAGVSSVVAILGHDAERVESRVGDVPSLRFVRNPRHAEGMLSSILCGLQAAQDAGAVLLHPVDHPLVSAETVERVADALRHGALIAVPSHEGRRGHPGGFARGAWDALRAVSPDRGARAVLADHPDWIVHVPGDAGCVAGVDTPADYERLIGPWR